MAKVLITGGSGMIGTHLSKLLTNSGHKVVHLSRSPEKNTTYDTFGWDIEKGEIDPAAFKGVTHIIHLAGAGVAEKRWTEKRKAIILNSRTESAKLLFDQAKKANIKLETFISASGISYYGMDTGHRLLNEDTRHGEDFLSEVAQKWEQSADQFSEITEVTKIRVGIVLSREGGALPRIAFPTKIMAGAPLGTGKQFMSWIHIDDLSRIFQFVMENNITGTYNAVAPTPVTNEEFTKTLAKVLKRPLLLPNVPAFTLKIMFGQMADMILGGNKVLGKRIQQKGFAFQYTKLEDALRALF